MGTRQHLWRVRIQSAIVDVEREGDHAGKHNILDVRLDGRVAEEEGHSEEGADDHCVLATEKPDIAHKSRDEGAENTTRVGEGVVSPRLKRGAVESGPTSGQILTTTAR